MKLLLLSLKLRRSITSFNLHLNRTSKLSLTKRNMSCRRGWPSVTTKPKPCKPANPYEKINPRPRLPCDPLDTCRPPNLCSSNPCPTINPWSVPKYCNSSDPRDQTIPCDHSQPSEPFIYKRPPLEPYNFSEPSNPFKTMDAYPHKPWPVHKPSDWSPRKYVPPACGASDSCAPSHPCSPRLSQGEAYESPYSSSCQPLSPRDQILPSSDSQPNPCSSSCHSPSSTCPPTCPPCDDQNIVTQEMCSRIMKNAYPCPELISCEDPELIQKENFWRTLTIFGALPLIILTAGIVFEKRKEGSIKPRPEYIPYDYMYIRTKPFPWGDGNHTLFHNPIKNAVPPHGYEVEDPNAVKKVTYNLKEDQDEEDYDEDDEE